MFVTEGSEKEDKEKKLLEEYCDCLTFLYAVRLRFLNMKKNWGKLQDQQLEHLNIIPGCAVDLPCDFEDVYNPV